MEDDAETEELPCVCESCEQPCESTEQVLTNYSWVRGVVLRQEWCEACIESEAVSCSHCDRYVSVQYTVNTDDCTSCDECADDCHSYCESCDLSYCQDYGHGDHDDCRDDYSDDCLHNYSYTPRLIFRGEGKRHLGLELEVGARNVAAMEIHDRWTDLLYCKEDGSVDGFEMVSHPMTYSWITENFPFEVLDLIGEHGIAGPNGLHVHISRDGFDSRDHVNAFLHLMYANPDMVEAIARRDAKRWAKFEMVPFADDLMGKSHPSRGRLTERYAAVNTTNEETLEVRVFASTLNRTQLMAALGLVDAAAVYTQANQDLEHLDWEHFSAWVFAHGGYPELAEEMLTRCTPVLVKGRKDKYAEERAERARQARERAAWEAQRADQDRRFREEQEILARTPLAEVPPRTVVSNNMSMDDPCTCYYCRSYRTYVAFGEEAYADFYYGRRPTPSEYPAQEEVHA